MSSRGGSDPSLDLSGEAVPDTECGSSSDSEHEEGTPALHRRLSVSVAGGPVAKQTVLMQDYLLKYTSPLKGWKRRMFTLTPSALFYAKSADSKISVETRIAGASVAERSDKDFVFELNTSEKKLQLQATSRAKMEAWISALRKAVSCQQGSGIAGSEHNWRFASSKRAYVCGGCERRCSSASVSTLVCEVCQLPAHKLCAARIAQGCKWTTAESVPPVSRLTGGDVAHQWVHGNVLPGKCDVCQKACGGGKKLEDWHCLWCQDTVHDACLAAAPVVCTLGQLRMSTVAPTFVTQLESSLIIQAPPSRAPLVIFVNTKSGNNDGLRILRLCRRLLNPAQVIDLTQTGPAAGLAMVRQCESFRVLVCGGDGTVGWVMKEVDDAGLSQCRLGVMPLGTGNDLARVLGWSGGVSLDRDTLAEYLQCVEHARESQLDRWSVTVSALPAEQGSDAARAFERSRFGLSTDGRGLRVMSMHRRNPLADSEGEEHEGSSAAPSAPGTPPTLSAQASAASSLAPLPSTSSSPLSSSAAIFAAPAARSSPGTPASVSPRLLPRASHESLSSPSSRRPSAAAVRADPMVDRYLTHFEKSFSDVEASLDSGLALAESVASLCSVVGALIRFTGGGARELAQFNEIKSNLMDKTKLPVADSRSAILALIVSLSDLAVKVAEAYVPQESARELCVMNNYFGVGLDAKIALDFNTLREEHPEKCKSRIKNQMWYGVLGGKEMMQQTCKNLQKALVLECDGKVVELPRLQGIVVLNIASYMGGTNFWGSKLDKAFRAPSPNDGLLEVVAVSGTAQMAACKTLPGITPTRLAQAREVRLTLRTGVPVQVDGEAWMQAPCVVTISHKNRVRVLCRDKDLHQRLLSWRRDSGSEGALDLVFQLQLCMDELYVKLSDGPLGEKVTALFTAITAAREHLAEGKDPQPYFHACSQLLTHLRDAAAGNPLDPDVASSVARCGMSLHEAVARAPVVRRGSQPSDLLNADSPPSPLRTSSSLRLFSSPPTPPSRMSEQSQFDESEEMPPE